MLPSEYQDDSSPPNVLLIDDSVDVHRVLRARLRTEPLELVCVSTGAEGLERAPDLMPALILLDLSMPKMDGFEVLRRLKDAPATVNTPVIVLSGLTSTHDKVTAFDLGAMDFVTKPFEVNELKVRVRSALRLSSLVSMLSQRAQIDGLTGLWNRAHFDSRWQEFVSSATRHSRPLSLAVIDLDRFKSINDSFGHPAGDEVIQGLARLVGGTARSSDICCRFGGEEFCVILPDTGPDDAQVLCERIRTRLEEVRWPRHPERQVTCSIGIAGVTGSAAMTPQAWLEAADRNLYQAKEGGRNRIVVSDLSGPVQLADAS
ncbi:MAG: diguanylate cyclase [Planctomycetota bacterium]